jgi:broad specificity phosphatase PhoE
MSIQGADVIWLVRHGEREDFENLDWGKTAERPHDPALSSTGIRQARAVGERLANEGIGRIFTSGYLRCAQTAHLIAECVRVPIHIEPGLGELHHPDWSAGVPALLPAHALAELTGAFDLTHDPFHAARYPETLEEAFVRASATARHIVDRYPDRVLLVGHAVSVIGIVRAFTESDGDVPCPPATLFRLERDGDAWKLT